MYSLQRMCVYIFMQHTYTCLKCIARSSWHSRTTVKEPAWALANKDNFQPHHKLFLWVSSPKKFQVMFLVTDVCAWLQLIVYQWRVLYAGLITDVSIQVRQELLHLVAFSVILLAVYDQTWSYTVRWPDGSATYTTWDFSCIDLPWSTISTVQYRLNQGILTPHFMAAVHPPPQRRKCQAVDGTGICHSCRWFFFWFQVASFLPCISWRCEVFARKVENTFWTHSASAGGYWQQWLGPWSTRNCMPCMPWNEWVPLPSNATGLRQVIWNDLRNFGFNGSILLQQPKSGVSSPSF